MNFPPPLQKGYSLERKNERIPGQKKKNLQHDTQPSENQDPTGTALQEHRTHLRVETHLKRKKNSQALIQPTQGRRRRGRRKPGGGDAAVDGGGSLLHGLARGRRGPPIGPLRATQQEQQEDEGGGAEQRQWRRH